MYRYIILFTLYTSFSSSSWKLSPADACVKIRFNISEISFSDLLLTSTFDKFLSLSSFIFCCILDVIFRCPAVIAEHIQLENKNTISTTVFITMDGKKDTKSKRWFTRENVKQWIIQTNTIGVVTKICTCQSVIITTNNRF